MAGIIWIGRDRATSVKQMRFIPVRLRAPQATGPDGYFVEWGSLIDNDPAVMGRDAHADIIEPVHHMPLFSVIIPTYNRSALIGRALDSVLSQGRSDLEVIVVDDGSTDGTLEMLRRYDRRIQIFEQANKGPGAARNRGLKEARGEYVAFLDSDDLWFPWTCSTYQQVIERHGRPGFIAGKPFVFDSDDAPFPTGGDELKTLAFADYYASGDAWRWYSASSFVMRREAFLSVGGFTDNWVNAEDNHATMRMGTAKTFVQIISPATFGYRQHAGSAMSNQERNIAGMHLLIDDENAGRFPGGQARAKERMRIITRSVRAMAISLLNSGDRRAAWELYRRTFGWNLGLGRWAFLAGFPGRALTSRLRTCKS
jgi:hypothetical protein